MMLCFLELDQPFTMSEFIKCIKSLKTGKAPGPDGVVYEFIKNCPRVYEPLLKLFNEIFVSGVYPVDWKTCHILPLFKKGSVNDPGNYRGISLLSCVSKLYTKLLNNRLCKWARRIQYLCRGPSRLPQRSLYT